MYEDIYKNLSDSLMTAFSPLLKSQINLALKALDAVTESARKTLYEISSCYNQNLAIESAKHLSEICRSILPVIESLSAPVDNLDFLKDLNFQEDYIDLTENDCDAINNILTSSDLPDSPTKVSKGKMAVSEFIKAVLIPILAILLPMMQNAYYNKINSLESKNQQIQEQEYREQILQSLTDLQNSLAAIQEAQESQESCSCNHSDAPVPQNEELTDAPDEQYQSDTAE